MQINMMDVCKYEALYVLYEACIQIQSMYILDFKHIYNSGIYIYLRHIPARFLAIFDDSIIYTR